MLDGDDVRDVEQAPDQIGVHARIDGRAAEALFVKHDADVDRLGEALVPVDDRLAAERVVARRREHHCDGACFPRSLSRAPCDAEVGGMDAGDDREFAVGGALRRCDDDSDLLGRQRHVFAVAAGRDEEAAGGAKAAAHHVAYVSLDRLGLELEIVSEDRRDERTGPAQALPNGFPVHGMVLDRWIGAARARTTTAIEGLPGASWPRRGARTSGDYLPPSVTRPTTGSSMAPSPLNSRMT